MTNTEIELKEIEKQIEELNSRKEELKNKIKEEKKQKYEVCHNSELWKNGEFRMQFSNKRAAVSYMKRMKDEYIYAGDYGSLSLSLKDEDGFYSENIPTKYDYFNI